MVRKKCRTLCAFIFYALSMYLRASMPIPILFAFCYFTFLTTEKMYIINNGPIASLRAVILNDEKVARNATHCI